MGIFCLFRLQKKAKIYYKCLQHRKANTLSLLYLIYRRITELKKCSHINFNAQSSEAANDPIHSRERENELHKEWPLFSVLFSLSLGLAFCCRWLWRRDMKFVLPVGTE